MNNKGQSILAEHVMIFFVVITALVAMTTFIQRGFEARVHDAGDFMINSVMNASVCDANCLQATGNQILYGYEPYYVNQFSGAWQNETDNEGATSGSAKAIGAVYFNSVNEESQTNTTSSQLPPCAADMTANPWCGNAGT